MKLPITIVYKPQSIIGQAIYRIAEKIIQSETLKFDDSYDITQASDTSFEIATEEANDDFGQKMAYIEELAGTGALVLRQMEKIRLGKTGDFRLMTGSGLKQTDLPGGKTE